MLNIEGDFFRGTKSKKIPTPIKIVRGVMGIELANYAMSRTFQSEREASINNMTHLIRAHQLCNERFNQEFEDRSITFWSAPNYQYRNYNLASILEIDEQDNRYFNIFSESPENMKKNLGTKSMMLGADKIISYDKLVYLTSKNQLKRDFDLCILFTIEYSYKRHKTLQIKPIYKFSFFYQKNSLIRILIRCPYDLKHFYFYQENNSQKEQKESNLIPYN